MRNHKASSHHDWF